MRVGGLGTQNKGDVDVGPSGQAFGREEQTSPEGRVSERKMAAVPRGLWSGCWQDVLPSVFTAASLWAITRTLSGRYYVSHFRAEKVQAFLGSLLTPN